MLGELISGALFSPGARSITSWHCLFEVAGIRHSALVSVPATKNVSYGPPDRRLFRDGREYLTPPDAALTKERLGQIARVKMQLDTSLGGGDQWVCHASARAAPQTESILRVHALRHRDYQR